MINLIICLPVYVSCGRDNTELDEDKAQLKLIFRGNRDKQNHKVKPKKNCLKTETNEVEVFGGCHIDNLFPNRNMLLESVYLLL